MITPQCDRCRRPASVESDTPPGKWCRRCAPNHGWIGVLETVPPHPKCPTSPPHAGGPFENDLHCSWCHWLYQQDRALQAFGEVLVDVVRAMLFVHAVEGETLGLRSVAAEGRIDASDDNVHGITASYLLGEWHIWLHHHGESERVRRIQGTPEDTAAEVVDFLMGYEEKL